MCRGFVKMKSKFEFSKWRKMIGAALGVTLAANISVASAEVNTTGLAVTDKTVTVVRLVRSKQKN